MRHPLFNIIDKPAAVKSTPKSKKSKDEERGCSFCPMNEVEGITKIKGSIKGRDILVIGQSPGPEENDQGIELIGPSGEWWWEELGRVGIYRDDVDVFNAMKCFPADWVTGTYNSYLKMRNPAPAEIHCCSVYSEKHLAKSKAKQILILGQVAAKAILKLRSVPSIKIFYSEQVEARVYLFDHPAFFIRGYGKGPRLDTFRSMLDRVAAERGQLVKETFDITDAYGYLKEQDYRLVTTATEAFAAEKIIRAAQHRICVDIEYDEGLFGCGFCPKKGQSFFFIWEHKDLDNPDPAVKRVAKGILEDKAIEKTLHYGCSDVTALAEKQDIHVRGFTHDTNMSEFLRFSDVEGHSYGLAAIAERRFQEFSGYKHILTPELAAGAALDWAQTAPDKKVPKVLMSGTADAQDAWLVRNKAVKFRHLSLETLRLYNGADCDLGKRIELSNKKHVSQSLMRLYIDLSFILQAMEPNGPIFDSGQCAKLMKLFPGLAEKEQARIRQLVGDKDFKPGSPQQVYKVLYNQMGLEYPFSKGKPDTRKMTLLMLGRKHEFPRAVLAWRSVSKVASMLQSYQRSAAAHGGQLRTKWWGTGARTGRLASGGEKKNKDSTIVNLQNIKRDEKMRNLCVADTRWRDVYRAITLICRSTKDEEERKAAAVKWVIENAPDLCTYLVSDYGQVEVRVAAQLSGDKNLIKDCASADIHTTVGTVMTGWDADMIRNDEEVRTMTKNVHFAILFRVRKENLYDFVVAMSPEGMGGRITREQLYEAFDNYFARYPGVARFIENQEKFAIENGYVTTAFGMVQTLNVTEDNYGQDEAEYIDPDEVFTRSTFWANQAVNGPVQGTAHQLLICGLVNLRRKRKEYRVLGVPVADVHDALYFRVRLLDLEESYVKSKYLMEKESLATVASDFPDVKWRVPIVVEAKAGLSLGALVKINKDTTPGDLLLGWYYIRKKQLQALKSELEALENGTN
jgi:uracil-DNA glycosylase family 4